MGGFDAKSHRGLTLIVGLQDLNETVRTSRMNEASLRHRGPWGQFSANRLRSEAGIRIPNCQARLQAVGCSWQLLMPPSPPAAAAPAVSGHPPAASSCQLCPAPITRHLGLHAQQVMPPIVYFVLHK